jgi:hypothetical protein
MDDAADPRLLRLLDVVGHRIHQGFVPMRPGRRVRARPVAAPVSRRVGSAGLRSAIPAALSALQPPFRLPHRRGDGSGRGDNRAQMGERVIVPGEIDRS